MRVDTPFLNRPPTPWLFNFPQAGMGDVADTIGAVTDAYRAVESTQPGMYTAQLADGTVVTYRQPLGNQTNLPIGNVQGNIGAGLTGNISSGSGVWILLGVGAVLLLFLGKGRR